jgi:hypothetical protein
MAKTPFRRVGGSRASETVLHRRSPLGSQSVPLRRNSRPHVCEEGCVIAKIAEFVAAAQDRQDDEPRLDINALARRAVRGEIDKRPVGGAAKRRVGVSHQRDDPRAARLGVGEEGRGQRSEKTSNLSFNWGFRPP